MKGWKEKMFKLVQRIWNHFDTSIKYFILFMLFISPLLLSIDFIHPYSLQINDSTRYFLSALVQSQAAILAIVVTMTLIAVQLVSSYYSPRVIDIFKNNPIIWRFLFLYGFSIFFGLFTLMRVQDKNPEIVFLNCYSIPAAHCVNITYCIGIGTFAALFLYMRNIFNILKPDTIIKQLLKNITKDKNLEYISSIVENKENPKQPIKKCPAQPIVYIIYNALRKDDIETVRCGLAAVTDWAEGVIEQIDPDNDLHIKTNCFSEDFCNRLEQFVKLGVKRENEEVVIAVIDKLETFAYSTAQKGLDGATMTVIDSLEHIKQIVVEMEWEKATECIIWSLGMTGNYAVGFEAEQMRKIRTGQVVKSLTSIGEIATEKRFELAILQAAQFIAFVGIDATQRDRLENSRSLEDIVLQAAQSLATLTDLRKGVKKAIECLKPILSKEGKDEEFQSFMELYERELEKRW